ncbi:MAG TPA: nucleotidyltransferase domain-containing protein [Patescibacteria group bacterium]|jgi:predicted nucleotidyltransferase|nr:nucleotidyltransferase domain-containing protein [Patescibacteria group bacterium]
MLAERIHNTIRFFDLQQFPLTAFEIHRYLITDLKTLRSKIDESYELRVGANNETTQPLQPPIHFDTILTQLRVLVFEKRIAERNGFYCLIGRDSLVADRQKNYLNGLKREKLIARYMPAVKHLPFVRSVALLGSQAMGQQKPTSDIDLFVITDPRFLGLGRFFITSYFQILGLRRHDKKVANRFCLNHYLAGSLPLSEDRNLYTALEYAKFRSLVRGTGFKKFLVQNNWISEFLPHFKPAAQTPQSSTTKLQNFFEGFFDNRFGLWLEQRMINSQLKRIEKGKFNIASTKELSFHPNNRKQKLFEDFFAKGNV